MSPHLIYPLCMLGGITFVASLVAMHHVVTRSLRSHVDRALTDQHNVVVLDTYRPGSNMRRLDVPRQVQR